MLSKRLSLRLPKDVVQKPHASYSSAIQHFSNKHRPEDLDEPQRLRTGRPNRRRARRLRSRSSLDLAASRANFDARGRRLLAFRSGVLGRRYLRITVLARSTILWLAGSSENLKLLDIWFVNEDADSREKARGEFAVQVCGPAVRR